MCELKISRQVREHTCLDCLHKAHGAGQCDYCNCGESEVLHTSLGKMARHHLIVGKVRETPMREKYEFDLAHRVTPKDPIEGGQQ